MRYTESLLSLLPSLFLPLVAADCWSEKGPQADHSRGLDLLYSATVTMSGQFRSGQTKIGCIDDYALGNHYYLTVKKKNGGAQAAAEYLYRGLQQQISACREGGHLWDYDWEFNVDTLVGVCIDPDWLNSHPETVPSLS
ncbi:hypothetical protein P154DRAFT_536232 [Amniculicola lignicola CBS 123094]|uniref:Uncharacterized protein n=1 Tax=Amniculicola lignicola CBS 123094 TaxID=1392246 RepID=A0A6A5W9V9_9PLEO|nr:hypothetical protein P154DRAFT_536232 [Amniculicola lignicola CBS 123094]